jgi:hypothetical protein
MQNTPFAQQQRQVNAFLEKTRQLGAQMDRDQGTTRIIFDTTGNVNTRTTFDFFNEVASKVFPATNLDNNRFQNGEGMVIKEIYIADLTTRTNFLAVGAMFSVLDFIIGNNRVLKSIPLTAFSTKAALNPLNSAVQSTATQILYYTGIRLRTNIIIPPLVQFTAQLRSPVPLGTVEEPVNIKLAIKGYGKLFNPNANY